MNEDAPVAMDAMTLLLTRESAARLQEPAPSEEALALILKSAVRAPDHGRLRPWRFAIIQGAARERFGDVLAASLKDGQPGATPEMLERERKKPLRAPAIVVVAAHLSPGKIPEIEQILSAGAAAQNIMLAAHALGYGAMWKTGAPAYDPLVKRALGLDEGDAIVGFIYLGTRAAASPLTARPSPDDFVTTWTGKAAEKPV